jgi:hypothetical protein
LATLRELFGQPIPVDSQPNAGQQIRPGLWRKIYGRAHKGYYMLRPTLWNLRNQVRQPLSQKEIAEKIDKRPLLQLRSQINDVMGQITVRAAAGEENAIHNLLASARGIIGALETVQKAQPKKLRAIAEESLDWPVLA